MSITFILHTPAYLTELYALFKGFIGNHSYSKFENKKLINCNFFSSTGLLNPGLRILVIDIAIH